MNLNAEDFYKKRDDRINRYAPGLYGYQEAKILVICSPESMYNYSGQLTALTLTNILSRFCRKITIISPRIRLHSLLGDNQELLSEQILKTIYDADPFGQFRTMENVTDDENWDCIVLIGKTFSDLKVIPTISIDSNGWLAYIGNGAVNFNIKYEEEINPVGPGLAAALCANEVFNLSPFARNGGMNVHR